MEISLKRDVQREVKRGNGRILLHDEVEHAPGQYTITPEWETVTEDEIMTPRVSDTHHTLFETYVLPLSDRMSLT